MTDKDDIVLADVDRANLYDVGIPIDFAITTMKVVRASGMGVAFRSRERGITDIEAFESIGPTKSIDIKTKANKIGMHRNSIPVNAAINRTADNQPQPLMPTPNEEIIQLTRSLNFIIHEINSNKYHYDFKEDGLLTLYSKADEPTGRKIWYQMQLPKPANINNENFADKWSDAQKAEAKAIPLSVAEIEVMPVMPMIKVTPAFEPLMVYAHNGKPIVSDIDLFFISKPSVGMLDQLVKGNPQLLERSNKLINTFTDEGAMEMSDTLVELMQSKIMNEIPDISKSDLKKNIKKELGEISSSLVIKEQGFITAAELYFILYPINHASSIKYVRHGSDNYNPGNPDSPDSKITHFLPNGTIAVTQSRTELAEVIAKHYPVEQEPVLHKDWENILKPLINQKRAELASEYVEAKMPRDQSAIDVKSVDIEMVPEKKQAEEVMLDQQKQVEQQIQQQRAELSLRRKLQSAFVKGARATWNRFSCCGRRPRAAFPTEHKPVSAQASKASNVEDKKIEAKASESKKPSATPRGLSK